MTADAYAPDELYGDDACAVADAGVPHEWRRRKTDGGAYLAAPQWAVDLLRWSPAGSEPEVLARAAADPEWRDAALFVLSATLDDDAAVKRDDPFWVFIDAHLPGWADRARAEGRAALGRTTFADLLGGSAARSDP